MNSRSRRVLGFAATGLGKSTMTAAIAREVGSMLVIVPTREIAFQIMKRLRREGVPAQLEMADYRASAGHRWVVATIQTLRTGRWRKFADVRYDMIVVDEAHHAHPFNTYAEVLSVWGMGPERGRERAGKLLFLTATPIRNDGVALGHFVDEIAFSYSVQWGVDNGWLVPPTVYGVYHETEVSEELAVLDAVHESEPPALAFVSSVSAIHDVVDRLISEGYRAAGVWGAQNRIDRNAAVEGFAAGRLDVLVAHNALTEGWDAPNIRTIILTRGTDSDVLYTQMIGRGLRPLCDVDTAANADERKAMIAASEKPTVVVYDLVPKLSGREIVSFVDLIGKEPDLKTAKSRKIEAEEIVREKTGGVLELAVREPDRIEKTLRILDVLTGRVEEDGIWWFRVGDWWATYVETDPLDKFGLPAVYFAGEQEVVRYNIGGWCRAIRAPRRAYMQVYRGIEDGKTWVESVFKEHGVGMPTRVTKETYGFKAAPGTNVPAGAWRRIRAAAKVLQAFDEVSSRL